MAIDKCPHSFKRLTNKVLPNYLKRLRANMKHPISARDFDEPRMGLKTLVKKLEPDNASDFSGCYVFMNRLGKPFYVGISRGVVGRLKQHLRGEKHNDASLAFTMARSKLKPEMQKLTRETCMKKRSFSKQFTKAKRLLRGAKIAVVQIDNPLELYLFEAYCAIELDTSKWNTFRTH